MRPEDRKVIGKSACVDCGAVVELRVNKGGRVYQNCDGMADPDGRCCYASLTFSKAKSVKLINQNEGEGDGEVERDQVGGGGTPIGGALRRGRSARGSIYDEL